MTATPSGLLPCLTIGYAITQANAGDTIQIAAGSYAENLTIETALTFAGPNAGIDPNTGSRVAEATVDGGSLTAFEVNVPNVTIDGLTVTTSELGFRSHRRQHRR